MLLPQHGSLVMMFALSSSSHVLKHLISGGLMETNGLPTAVIPGLSAQFLQVSLGGFPEVG